MATGARIMLIGGGSLVSVEAVQMPEQLGDPLWQIRKSSFHAKPEQWFEQVGFRSVSMRLNRVSECMSAIRFLSARAVHALPVEKRIAL